MRSEQPGSQQESPKEHKHTIAKVVLAIGLLDLLLTASFLVNGVMSVAYGVSAAVRFCLWVVLPVLFIRGTFDR